MTDKKRFKVYVVKYWHSKGLFESDAEEGYTSEHSGVKYIYLFDPKGNRDGWDSLRMGTDAVLTKSEAVDLVHKLADKKVKSLNKQIQKVLERAKNPWGKK